MHLPHLKKKTEDALREEKQYKIILGTFIPPSNVPNLVGECPSYGICPPYTPISFFTSIAAKAKVKIKIIKANTPYTGSAFIIPSLKSPAIQ